MPENPDAAKREREFDKVIFRRDLYEVHLLMDFISGRNDTNLADLEVAMGDGTTLKGIAAVQEVTDIRYPPTGPRSETSREAAFLLATKNSLTTMAQPARGLTIAFTAMFVGLGYEAARRSHQSFWYRVGRMAQAPLDWAMDRLVTRHAKDRPDPGDDPMEALNRSQVALARTAFPGLLRPVRRLRFCLTVLMLVFFFVWLPLTAVTYWDVSYLRTTMQPLEQAARDRLTLALANPTLDDDSCKRLTDENKARPSDTQRNDQARALLANCQHLATIDARKEHARVQLKAFINCTGYWTCHFYHPIRWSFLKFMGTDSTIPNDMKEIEFYGASLLAVFANYVLPMMFGVLGAGVRMLRVIQYKVRDSLLGPRDLVLTYIGLLIGAVAGVAVGLFLAPSEISTAGAIATITLTASGLGFLAGYGSDHFLQMLDVLLDRVFVAEPAPGTAPPQDRAAGNGRPKPDAVRPPPPPADAAAAAKPPAGAG